MTIAGSELPQLYRDQRKIDADHLKLLSIFHFVGAILGLLGILFVVGHYAIFSAFFSNPKIWENQAHSPPPPSGFFATVHSGKEASNVFDACGWDELPAHSAGYGRWCVHTDRSHT